MGHKAVLVLGFALLALVVACGDTQPLPDIDATVEARVALAKASLVAPTAAPLPTYTPMPTYTPAPALAPEVRDAVVCVPSDHRRTRWLGSRACCIAPQQAQW